MEGKIEENTIYISKDGKLTKINKPKNGYGKTTIHWQSEKPVRIETNYTEEIK